MGIFRALSIVFGLVGAWPLFCFLRYARFDDLAVSLLALVFSAFCFACWRFVGRYFHQYRE